MSPEDVRRPARLVEDFFRHETGRLHGALIRMMGVEHFALAEDVAQEALLKAMTTWSMGGVPTNPSAWITRVAMNLARDALRRRRMASGKETSMIAHFEALHAPAPASGPEDNAMRDDTLRLLFVCCHPQLAPDAQVVLALKVICGFSTGEIARAFLAGDAAVDKQLGRTKNRIRELGVAFEIPCGADLDDRLDGVLATLYLLFNEGHSATSGDATLREDLCREAIRLTTLLAGHPSGDTPRTHALLALMLLTSARFPQRFTEDGALLRLEDQDRARWNRSRIDEGLASLERASSGDRLTTYHLEAAIAACHATAPDFVSTDWKRIITLYDALLRIRPSPVVALNRAVAVAQASGPEAGLDALGDIGGDGKMEERHLYHAVRGDFLRKLGDEPGADEAYRKASSLAPTEPERRFLESRRSR